MNFITMKYYFFRYVLRYSKKDDLFYIKHIRGWISLDRFPWLLRLEIKRGILNGIILDCRVLSSSSLDLSFNEGVFMLQEQLDASNDVFKNLDDAVIQKVFHHFTYQ